MINDIFWWLQGVARTIFEVVSLVVALGWISGKVDIRWKNKYKWRCPEDNCYFKIDGSDQNMTFDVAADHMIKFHEGRPGRLKP